MTKNILLVSGGGGTEHDVSLISADFISNQIDHQLFHTHSVLIDSDGKWSCQGLPVNLTLDGRLDFGNESFPIHAAIPCIHGAPGETGEIQAFLKICGIPYIGCEPEASIICFNKLATKLFLNLCAIPTTPFIHISSPDTLLEAQSFLKQHGVVYVKATHQGSSVGCYRVTTETELSAVLPEAFHLSPYVIIEKGVSGRELEVAAFEYQGAWHFSHPGEIICPQNFYSFEEKYSEASQTSTVVSATNLTDDQKMKIKEYSQKAVELLRLRHLARIDFFLSTDGEIYLNEINTFPGHTSISMFPSMMEHTNVRYSDFINSHLNEICKK